MIPKLGDLRFQTGKSSSFGSVEIVETKKLNIRFLPLETYTQNEFSAQAKGMLLLNSSNSIDFQITISVHSECNFENNEAKMFNDSRENIFNNY